MIRYTIYSLNPSNYISIEINLFHENRYLDLTEEEKEKLRGSHKVAKKLEKLEHMGQDR